MKLVEIKKKKNIPDIYGTVTPDPNVNSVNDVLHIIPNSSCS